MEEVKDSALGSVKLRIRFIKTACCEIKTNVIEIVQEMFTTRAHKTEELLKLGQIVPIFKKGSRTEPNNYMGVCLLALASRILVKVFSKRLRDSTESLNILNNSQSGFRPNRSTADATQILAVFRKIDPLS